MKMVYSKLDFIEMVASKAFHMVAVISIMVCIIDIPILTVGFIVSDMVSLGILGIIGYMRYTQYKRLYNNWLHR